MIFRRIITFCIKHFLFLKSKSNFQDDVSCIYFGYVNMAHILHLRILSFGRFVSHDRFKFTLS